MQDTITLVTQAFSILSTLAVLITLVYLARQTNALIRQTSIQDETLATLIRQTELQSKTLSQNIYATVEAVTLEIDMQFLVHHELRPYFYGGQDIRPNMRSKTYRKVEAMCEMFIDFFDHILTIINEIPEAASWSKEWWDRWIIDMFRNSPPLRRYYLSVRDWYPDDLFSLYQIACDQIDPIPAAKNGV